MYGIFSTLNYSRLKKFDFAKEDGHHKKTKKRRGSKTECSFVPNIYFGLSSFGEIKKTVFDEETIFESIKE